MEAVVVYSAISVNWNWNWNTKKLLQGTYKLTETEIETEKPQLKYH